MAMDLDGAFWKHVEQRYKGKVWRIERTTSLSGFDEHYIVRVEFHIPVDEVQDEMGVYKRINRVLEVIAEGD